MYTRRVEQEPPTVLSMYTRRVEQEPPTVLSVNKINKASVLKHD